jgi:lysophospholipase L1-like esterase
MNLNSNAKRILCFGDSLTFGHDPVDDKRYEPSERWTGVLQGLLGEDYEVIEEGLGGRLTDIDDPKNEGRNGLKYFSSAVMSHVPLQFIIILLGTNDLKSRFKRSANDIAASFRKYKNAITVACDKWRTNFPKVILLSPPILNETKTPKDWHFEGAGIKSEQLAIEYKKIAHELDFYFVDIAPIAPVSDIDGTHVEKSVNAKIGSLLASKILSISSI